MRRIYAYKVVRGELSFKNNEDKEKILRLIDVWRKTVNDYQHRRRRMRALPKKLQMTANEFIEQQRKSREAKRLKGEPVLHERIVQMHSDNARFIDEDFRHMALTTLEPRKPVVAEFRCRRATLLKEALNSPLRCGCRKPRHVLEVCHPKLVYEEHGEKLYLIYAIRKLVSLNTLEELEDTLNEGFDIVSVDVNLDDVTYAVFHLDNAGVKRLHIDRYRLNIDDWMMVRKIDAFAKKRHGMAVTRHCTKLKRRGAAKAGEVADEVLRVAKKFDAEAIVYERLSNKFPKKSKDYNYKIHRWNHRRIAEYLVNRARWDGLAALPIPARGTSSRCPKCNAKLPKPKTRTHRDWQVQKCRVCGFTDDRDHIACTNMAKKFIVMLLKLRLRNILL